MVELLHGSITEQIIGSGMEVHNTLGPGLLEKVYENAMTVELRLRRIPFDQQPAYDVMYKDTPVGLYVPDLVVREAVVVDAKAIERIGEHELGLMLNYLGITGLRVGLIINFRNIKLEWKRVVL